MTKDVGSIAKRKPVWAVTIQIRIGDEEGNHSIHRCAYQPLFIEANTGKEAEELALKHPDVTSSLTPYFDEAVVVARRKVPAQAQ